MCRETKARFLKDHHHHHRKARVVVVAKKEGARSRSFVSILSLFLFITHIYKGARLLSQIIGGGISLSRERALKSVEDERDDGIPKDDAIIVVGRRERDDDDDDDAQGDKKRQRRHDVVEEHHHHHRNGAL